MLVMAGKAQKGHFLMESVADKVVKNSPVPVVIIPIPSQKNSSGLQALPRYSRLGDNEVENAE